MRNSRTVLVSDIVLPDYGTLDHGQFPEIAVCCVRMAVEIVSRYLVWSVVLGSVVV